MVPCTVGKAANRAMYRRGVSRFDDIVPHTSSYSRDSASMLIHSCVDSKATARRDAQRERFEQ